MNEPKSSRYHRLRRRAGVASLASSALLLATALYVQPVLPIALYVLLLMVLNELLTLPIAYFRNYSLEHRYELSSAPAGRWLRDELVGFAIATSLAVGGARVVYALIGWNATWWWAPAAALGAAATLLLARLTPIVLLPLFYKLRPLQRASLNTRLVDLSDRAGVPVLGVFEWGLGAKTRRANAALVGSGSTRRILLSDTLLEEYSDDEIEVILAHELAHHVHRDIAKGILLELVLLLAGGLAASAAINVSWAPLGLHGPADPRGLPVLLFAAGAVVLAATPIVNAVSRFNERRADEFALALTGRTEAFVSAMRRLGAQNLSEESPSKASVWLFHTHPPIAERIAAARSAPPRPA